MGLAFLSARKSGSHFLSVANLTALSEDHLHNTVSREGPTQPPPIPRTFRIGAIGN